MHFSGIERILEIGLQSSVRNGGTQLILGLDLNVTRSSASYLSKPGNLSTLF